jgi:transposase InsO family protein
MKSTAREYAKVKAILMPQMRKCRDRDIRIKVELILLGLRLGNISLACRRQGVSRKFYHKWWSRLFRGHFQLKALEERSRRPKRSPRRLCGEVEARIRFFRRRRYGAHMIKAFLEREGWQVSARTINHVLNNRRPPPTRKRRRIKLHSRRYELVIPGQRLQIDVKYVPHPVAGAQVFSYVAIDECTRWRFARTYPAVNEHQTISFLNSLMACCPFPINCIQTDNGPEFTFRLLPGNTREHAMDIWCKAHKIHHRLIPPGVKELNGKVERSHRIDEDYFYHRSPQNSLESFNRSQAAWISFYNAHRPHGGVTYQTPLEKLAERLAGLREVHFEGALERMRVRFLKEAPMMATREDRQLLQAQKTLEADLLRYNHVA